MEGKPLVLSWSSGSWLAGAEKSAVVKKRPGLLSELSGKYFLRVSTQELWSKVGQGCIPCWKLNLAIVSISHSALVLVGQLKAVEAWHSERPGKEIEDAVSIAGETPVHWLCWAVVTATDSLRCWVETSWTYETGCVCCVWQSLRGGVTQALWSLKDPQWTRGWTLRYLHH